MSERYRAYYVYIDLAEGECVAVVAENTREAKKIGFEALREIDLDFEWTELRVKWIRDANVDGLQKGVVDVIEGLKRGIYSYAEGFECPKCGEEGILIYKNGEVICLDCVYKEQEVVS